MRAGNEMLGPWSSVMFAHVRDRRVTFDRRTEDFARMVVNRLALYGGDEPCYRVLKGHTCSSRRHEEGSKAGRYLELA